MADKKGFFGRLGSFLGGLFAKKTEWRDISESKFAGFLSELEESAENYDDVRHVIELCDEAVSVIYQRIMSIDKLRGFDESVTELEQFSRLSEDDANRLKELLDRFVSLMRDKKAIRGQLAGFDRSLAYLKNIEGDANAAITEMKEAEENQRVFRQDLAYLESENAELEYDRENLAAGQKFIHNFSFALLGIFGAAIMLLGYLYFFQRQDVFFPAIVLVIMMIIIAALIYAFRRRVKFELELNVKKQKRAAELINQKTVVYSHYINFLNFSYRKYKIRNSEMLKDTISEYNLYKHLNARLDSIRSIMYQTEAEIGEFLKEKGMFDIAAASIESFAESIDIQNKRDYYKRLVNDRNAVESRLTALDAENELIWDKLMAYQEVEGDPEGIMSRIIKACVDEMGRIIENSKRISGKS